MQTRKTLFGGVAAAALALAAGGCSTLHKAERTTSADEAQAIAALQGSLACEPQKNRISDGVWLGDGSGTGRNGDPLPAAFNRPDAVRLLSDDLDFGAVLGELATVTGWRVYIAADEIRQQAGGQQQVILPGATPGATGTNMPQGRMRFDFPAGRTSVAGALDAVARRYNLGWEADAREKAIRFTRTQTRTFQLAALPADVTVKNAIDPSGSSQQATAGGSTQITANPQPGRQQVTTTVDQQKIWSQVDDGIKTILGGKGDVSLSPATGIVVVRTDADRMRDVASYIALQNETRLRGVRVRVVVLNVRLNDSDEYAMRLTPAFKESGYTLTGSGTNTVSTTTGIASLTASILSSPPAGYPFKRFAGSQAIVNALSTLGRVSVRNEVTVDTLNDQPTPLLVGSQTSYLASVSQSAVSSVGTQTSLVPGIVTSGTTLNVLPRIRGDGRMVLNYALSISELVRLNNVSSGGQTIQVPEVATRALQQAVDLENCQTLMLAGFQQERTSVAREGTGWPDFLGLGGTATGSSARDLLAIFVTPEIRASGRDLP